MAGHIARVGIFVDAMDQLVGHAAHVVGCGVEGHLFDRIQDLCFAEFGAVHQLVHGWHFLVVGQVFLQSLSDFLEMGRGCGLGPQQGTCVIGGRHKKSKIGVDEDR